MDTHSHKTLETHPSNSEPISQQTLETHPSNSEPISQQTLDESSLILPLQPPYLETLDGPSPSSNMETLNGYYESSSILETLGDLPTQSPTTPDESLQFQSLTPDDCSNSPFMNLETLEEDDPSPSLPIVLYSDNLSNYSYPRWSSSWSVTETKPSVSSGDFAEVKPSMVGAGLENLGNTCFLNAVLQCFTHTVPLVQGLRSLNRATTCDCGNESFCVFCALREHIDLSLTYSGGTVSPYKLVNNLSYISSDFHRFQQEDAHEFLQALFDKLDSPCLTQDKIIATEDDKLVKRIFGGRLISRLQCCNCGHYSESYEPVNDLSLEIEDADTLSSALTSFTKVEKIDPYPCENCKEEVSREKQFMLDSAPSVAAFHLKRFKNDGSYVEKIDKHIEYPLELDLQPFTTCSQDVELKYELYAVVVHVGLLSTSGHYFSFIRSSPDTWYQLDDSKVTMVQEERVLSEEAYILFYARQGTPWFSSFMDANKPCLDQYMLNTSPKSVLDNVDNASLADSITANVYNCEVHETRDDLEGMSADFCSGSRRVGDEVNEARDYTCRSPSQTPFRVSGSCDESGTSSKFEKTCSTSPFGSNCNQNNEVKANTKIPPQTPPRSPSPDIYSKESPVVSFHIMRDHLKTKDQLSCKKALDKSLNRSKRKEEDDRSKRKKEEAIRYLKRSMPSSRSSKFMEAMTGSPKKNKKRKVPSPNKKSIPNPRRKVNESNVMHPFATTLFH